MGRAQPSSDAFKGAHLALATFYNSRINFGEFRYQTRPTSSSQCGSRQALQNSLLVNSTRAPIPTLLACTRSDSALTFSKGHQRFAFANLLITHLTVSTPPFASSLTATPLKHRSMKWFGACPCRPTAGGHTPNFNTAPLTSPSAFLAHASKGFQPTSRTPHRPTNRACAPAEAAPPSVWSAVPGTPSSHGRNFLRPHQSASSRSRSPPSPAGGPC